jgi:hypothetical protein
METLFRLVAGTPVPARWLVPGVPRLGPLPVRTGDLRLEVVSHCWKYAHLMAYQLSSLVRFPPTEIEVRMTVCHAPEDRGTAELLDYFGAQDVPGVTWNWQPMERTHLMRRAIGRNRAALATEADWVWFTDCDVIFHEGCLDGLARALQGRSDALVHPAVEWVTPLLSDDDPVLTAWHRNPGVLELHTGDLLERPLDRATGPMQITHGDAARTLGYCDALGTYQKPAETWQKAREDRAFRWLLGTQGAPVDVPGVHRIRHASKGRDRRSAEKAGLGGLMHRVRTRLRRRRGDAAVQDP